MKNTKKGRMAASILSALLCAGLALFSAGCSSDSDSSESGGGGNEVDPGTSNGIKSVTLNGTTLTLLTGTTAELTATVETTSDDIAKTVTWTSSDESVATVSGGTVTAVAAGSATITAASTVDTTKKATCAVTVESADSSEVLWRADEYEAQTCTDNQTLGIMNVIVGSGGSVSIDENSKSIDGYSFAKRLKFGGSGSTSKNSISFKTNDSATITVYYMSASSNGNFRTLNLSDGTDVVASGTNDGTAIASFSTTSAVAAGTYYIYSAGSGINVYAVKIAYESAQTIVYPSAVSLSESSLSLDASDGSTTKTATLTATIANASEVTSGRDTIEWTSSTPSVATVSNGVVTARKAGTATITAKCVYGGKYATCEVTVTGTSSGKTISASDKPTGYASITPPTGTGTTVKTKTELVNALKKSGLIYVSGTIDVSEGCLPSEAGGTTPQLDAFVVENSSYSKYSDFKTAYAGACSDTTEDGDSKSTTKSSLYDELWQLNKAYGNKIKLSPASNTTIIGLDGAVIKGGTFQISGVSNVTIRNLTIQDAYDPFPHHEVKSDGVTSDGFNAQWDGICLDGASNIWIDHCTIEDTMKCSNVTTKTGSEKWQTYDGLCDMKGSSKNIVVSYCVFKNHDKTMLIGSGSSDISGGNITIHHNKFLNCGQRLPMTTYPNMHIYNNSYERDSDAYYSQQASIAARYGAYTIIAENNYFGSGVKYCISQSTSPSGKCYESGNVFTSRSEGSKALSTQNTKPFTPSYEYDLDEASDVPSIVEENAGAGVWSVVQ